MQQDNPTSQKSETMAENGRRAFVTGGAGFIGSHLVDRLLADGYAVTIYDNLSSGDLALTSQHRDNPHFAVVRGDILDAESLTAAMRGHDVVWHLASSTNIRAGARDTEVDLRCCVIGTRNVLEAMRETGARQLLFASSGVVYGDFDANPLEESAGPLLPVSLYGAGKLSAEAFISAYCHLFDIRACSFRFANVIGERTNHGVVYDLVMKLLRTPASRELEVLGDGLQRKPYLLAEECVDGMLFAFREVPMTAARPCDIFNLGTDTSISVGEIAQIVVEEVGRPGVTIRYTGGRRGWAGDAPVILMGAEKLRRLGWTAQHTSTEAVRIAARRLVVRHASRPVMVGAD